MLLSSLSLAPTARPFAVLRAQALAVPLCVLRLSGHTTLAAVTLIPVDVQIIAGQRMVAGTAGLLGSLRCQIVRAAQHILAVCDRLQVIGIHTRRVITGMVKFQAVGNRADQQLVHKPMGRMLTTSDDERAVTFSRSACNPQPAAIRLWDNLRQEPLGRLTVHARRVA